ncbi:2-oxopent-4-enoate/cis-2-oxohex-4-enoate hydratase, partial [Geopseudomonas sagittaria]
MNQELIQQLGDELYQSMLSRETVAPLTSRYDLTIDDAYQISLRMLERRLAAGERI